MPAHLRARPCLLALVLVAASLIAAAPASAADGSGWSANAVAFRGENGTTKVFDCPKYGTVGSLYGTDVYTDDSSVCTAAVHAGFISLAGGGTVTIEIRPDAGSYTGTLRNRITSSSYPAWQGSYAVVAAQPTDAGVAPGAVPDGTDAWNATAAQYRTWVGAQYQFNCPRNGKPTRTVWGTNIYTDDSSVCLAAVHAGLITTQSGGKVTIEMRDGQASYRGSTRNKVKTNSYAAWGGSFVIVGAPEGPDDPEAVATGDVTVNGKAFSSGRVPYGSVVDVTRGTLKLTAKGVGNLFTFGDGTDLARFKLNKIATKVGKTKRTTAELALSGGDFGVCASPRRAIPSAGPTGKAVRSLWTQGKGRFRTKGQYSSATIRGTKWQTTDQCDGTLTTVTEGSVNVNDFRLKKVIAVRSGSSYLANAP
jgi:hypothetical protein